MNCTTLGVSKNGKVLYGYIETNSTRQAFIKTEANGIKILSNLYINGGSVACMPKAISDDGTLIAGICNYSFPPSIYGGTRPVYWNSGSSIQELERPYEIYSPPSFNSPDYLQIYSCTNTKIAGSYGKPCSQSFFGYVSSAVFWQAGIHYLQNPSLLAICGTSYTARAIAKNMDVVVGTLYNYPIGEIPVRWVGAGMEYLSTNQGVPNDVSDDGKIVVGKESGFAFRWSLEAGLEYLTKKDSTIPEPSNALSITGDGTYIVGEGYFPGGFIWSKATGVLNLTEFLASNYGLEVQLSGKILSPKKVQRENNMVIISGDIYSLADGNKKFIVKMLIEGISIRHFHQLENHLPKFQQKKLLKANEFGLIPEPFIVCADGSSASYFSMRRPKNSWLDISKYSFRIKEGNVSDLRRVGMISTPVKTLDSIIVKYTHPQFINDDSNHPVFAVFTLQVINDDLDIVEYEIPIQVYRPPVLMVHGIWSNGQAAFGVMGQALLSSNAYVNEQVNILDYEGSNDVSFELNKIIVPYHIAKTIEDIVAKGWSVGKVDVVCHSMGGNLTRNYLQRDYYFNDINKLITCNTPHSGTQATNLIFSNDGENIRKILKSYDFDFNAGAVSDLKVNSAAIFKMNNPPELNRHTVPSHSITTTATAEDIPEFEPYLKKLPKYFSELLEKALIGQTLEELYGEQHDNVVPISSQSGGLIGFSTSKIDNQFHQGSTSNPDVIEKVIELLKVDPVESSNFEFYGFNPVELEFPDGLKPQTEIGGKSLLSVSILNPVKGIEVSPGSILPIEIQGSSELTNIILFVEYSKDEFYAAALNSSNGLFNFEVDGDYLGKRNIIAIGIDASSQEMVIDSSYIIVKPSTPNFLGFNCRT